MSDEFIAETIADELNVKRVIITNDDGSIRLDYEAQ